MKIVWVAAALVLFFFVYNLGKEKVQGEKRKGRDE